MENLRLVCALSFSLDLIGTHVFPAGVSLNKLALRRHTSQRGQPNKCENLNLAVQISRVHALNAKHRPCKFLVCMLSMQNISSVVSYDKGCLLCISLPGYGAPLPLPFPRPLPLHLPFLCISLPVCGVNT